MQLTQDKTVEDRARSLVRAVVTRHCWQIAFRDCESAFADFCEEVAPVETAWPDREQVIDRAEAMYGEPWVQALIYPYGKPRDAREMELLQAYIVARHG